MPAAKASLYIEVIENNLPDIWCLVFCSQVMLLFSKEEFSCAAVLSYSSANAMSKGATGNIGRAGRQAKFISGCFELSMK